MDLAHLFTPKYLRFLCGATISTCITTLYAIRRTGYDIPFTVFVVLLLSISSFLFIYTFKKKFPTITKNVEILNQIEKHIKLFNWTLVALLLVSIILFLIFAGSPSYNLEWSLAQAVYVISVFLIFVMLDLGFRIETQKNKGI